MAEELAVKPIVSPPGTIIQFIEPPNQAVVYSNYCTVNVTSEELFFNFAIRKDAEQAIGIVKVFMSLAAAKRLSVAFNKTLEQHESVFGEIDTDRAAHLPAAVLAKLGISPQENDS